MTSEPASEPSVWRQLEERLDTGRFRPRAQPGIIACEQRTRRGRPYVVARNPEGSTYVNLEPWEYAVLLGMDGTRTIRDLLLLHYQQQHALELQGITKLVDRLQVGGFLDSPAANLYTALRLRLHPPMPVERLWLALAATVQHRWGLRVIEQMLRPLLHGGATLFGRHSWQIPAILLSSSGLVALTIALFGRHVSLVGDGPTPLHTMLAVLGMCWLASLVYGLARGVACGIAGWPTGRAGLRLLSGLPVLWVDAREAALAGPRGAMLVAQAGPWALLCFGALAAMAAALVPANPGLTRLALVAALVCYGLVLALLCPFIDLDGTAWLKHDLDVPDLQRSAWAFWRRRLSNGLVRRKRLDSMERALFAYGLLCLLWLSLVGLFVPILLYAGLIDLLAGPWTRGEAVVLGGTLVYLLICGGAQIVPVVLRPAQRGRARRFPWHSPSRRLRGRVAVFRDCPSLAALTDDQLLALASQVDELHYPEGMDVVVQGEAGDGFFVIMEGRAEVIDESGPTVLEQLQRGQSFGIYAMIYHTLRAATVRAITPLRVLRIKRSAFDAFLAPRLIMRERLAALTQERQALAAVPALAALDPQALDLLLPRLVIERYEPGESIIRQGEPGRHFYIVRSGTMEVLDESQEPPCRLNVLGTGAYFGEIALLLDMPRVATVRALVEVTVWSLSREDFDVMLGRYLGLTEMLTSAGQARLDANRRRNAHAEVSLSDA